MVVELPALDLLGAMVGTPALAEAVDEAMFELLAVGQLRARVVLARVVELVGEDAVSAACSCRMGGAIGRWLKVVF